MQPISPVAPGLALPEITFAKDQPEYNPLPAYRSEDGLVVTRWKLTWRERLDILLRGNLWLSVLTYNRPLQPVKLDTKFPLDSVVDRQGA
jgi:hypothetical protein